MLQKVAVQIVYKIACGQELMVGAGDDDLLQDLHGFLHAVKGMAPKGNVDLHGILRADTFIPEGMV